MSVGGERQALHRLVDSLTPAQTQRLQWLVDQDEELSRASHDADEAATEEVPSSLLALIGIIDGPPDLAERHDDYIRDRLRRDLGDQA
ncbi:hypothetical protein I6A60_19675 [Frankia sp. AgB1.9]|uniref:hypothetical protein n=1 Tax=unclassified Frankia TaxID=2632575 RepID=UPI0019346367|nr:MULTISPECIES: hypothetical protein [unclassified Frankia]MBL7492242.1 hypothetical protein [Frankia sp. AgW1.1]MBL7550082.1 hypothetical protein [Frankia sp. AgB1.9]MBL7621174.1 hypothetical protein [Frankia sp. AgB1.8]